MIENGVLHQLSSNSNVTDLVGDQIFLDSKGKSSTTFITISVITQSDFTNVQLEDGQSIARLQINCGGSDPLASKALAKEVKKALHTIPFENEYVECQLAIQLTKIPQFDDETGLYLESLDFEFYYYEVN